LIFQPAFVGGGGVKFYAEQKEGPNLETRGEWTNRSVIEFAKGADPVEAVTKAARDLAVQAMDQGWKGPPFDPLSLAEFQKIDVVPRDDVFDARTVPVGSSLRIEFNPNKPKARVRYSVAHEIAHTIFPDCAKTVRNRTVLHETTSDDWQLEALCNIAAAELLMPAGSLGSLTRGDLGVDHLLELRELYEVSSEAIFIRAAQMSEYPCAMFCASRSASEQNYHIDYTIHSPFWQTPIFKGLSLPHASVVSHCTAIGFTAKRDEEWKRSITFHVECVAIPGYPGSAQPRVVGMLTTKRPETEKGPALAEVKGNALAPRGQGSKLVVQVVNDGTPNWGGGGFAQALAHRWPEIQEDFRRWVESNHGALNLGNVRIANVDDQISVASMVCQKGYRKSVNPKIRYTALRKCLEAVAAFASQHHASAHMPRIGCGLAGGRWDVVRELVTATLSAKGVPVTVYDLPSVHSKEPAQQRLKLTSV
jgi:O-acetyl-ADP-ribose deacetylase (regulator of RNase III)